MSVINSNTLFHFTPTINGLKGILSKGLRMSYCYEELTCELGIAVPMISFCDIPLLRTLSHRATYGNYMVGFDKEYMIRRCIPNLNPVNYLNSIFIRSLSNESFNTLLEVVSHTYSNEIYRILKEKDYLNLVEEYGLEKVIRADESLHYKSDLISFAQTRLRYGLAFSKEYSTNKNGKEIINYNEREWRYITYYWNERDEESWVVPISLKEFKDKKSDLNSQLWTRPESYITVEPKDIVKAIKFIIVKKESQISQIIRFLHKSKYLFGTSLVTEEQKEMLISRTLSFDIIEQNF